MSQELADLYVQQYSTNLEMKLQQMGSKLRGRVEEGRHVGKMASPVQEVGAISLRAPAGRFAPKVRTDADFVRRWVFPQDGEIDQLIDSFDELKLIIDPRSKYVQNASAAVGRAWDDEIIRAATGSVWLGTDAAALTSEAFDTSNQRIADTFGSSAASGLTVAKLIETRRKLRKAQVDLESEALTVIAGSQQESDLLNAAQVTSKEYNDRPVLVDGKVTRLLGFDIVYSERLPTYTTNTRGVLAIAKSGMYLGIWKDMTNSVSKRTDLSGEPWDLYTSVSYGASRLQTGRVIQIACLDSTGADITP